MRRAVDILQIEVSFVSIEPLEEVDRIDQWSDSGNFETHFLMPIKF